jgi:hypothetical protein
VEHADTPEQKADMVEDDRDPEYDRKDIEDKIEQRRDRLAGQQQREWRTEKGEQIDHRLFFPVPPLN